MPYWVEGDLETGWHPEDVEEGVPVEDYGYESDNDLSPKEKRERYNDKNTAFDVDDSSTWHPMTPGVPTTVVTTPVIPQQPVIPSTGVIPTVPNPGIPGTGVQTNYGVGGRMSRLVVLPQNVQLRDRLLEVLKDEYMKALQEIMRDKVVHVGMINPALLPTEVKQQAMNMAIERVGADSANVASYIRASESQIRQMLSSIIAAGLSAILMAFTGNFPVAAMGYFAVKGLAGTARGYFNGTVAGDAYLDGEPILPLEYSTPEGLPNEIFEDYRFCCYDRLSGKWFPSDEIRPLPYQSNENYRWTCLDRVTQKIYLCNWIRKPNIYV